jgi:hypothetical protein
MSKKIMNVKDKSALHFFEEFSIQKRQEDGHPQNQSAYYYMKDELYLKKSFEIQEGETIVFHLEDQSYNSQKRIINIYTYTAGSYDDIGIKLSLTDFKIELV